MSQILLIKNSLDESESEIIESKNVLFDFLEVRKAHPQARIYLGNPCPENDITPTADNKESIQRLVDMQENCTIVCFAGKSALKWLNPVNWFASEAVDFAFKYFMPKVNTNTGNQASGSSNNNLSNPENKVRIKERIPYILGRVKAIPDLYAPAYRHFVDGVEVEELLLCLCENPVQVSNFKEGDTPVQEVTGKSVSAYDLNKDITGLDRMFHVGDTFNEAPFIMKQSNSINGQTLLTPNTTLLKDTQMYFQYPNFIKTLGSANNFGEWSQGDEIIIEGANFGIGDLSITGDVTINPSNNTISITSNQTVVDYQDYRKINITAMLVTDPINGQLDLAGLYDINNISYSGGIYTILLKDPVSTNANFANLTQDATTNISANLTANIASIFLDGKYVVSSIDIPNKTIALTTPSTENEDWLKLEGLNGKQTPVGSIKLRGSQENFIGWFTIESQDAEGVLLNFRAPNGIYEGEKAKSVTIEAQYQQVVNGVPTGSILNKTITMTGVANNRDSVGGSMWIELPFSGAVRFRARRTNDNGDNQGLVDETKFYQAYAYQTLKKLAYDNRVIIRTRTVATVNATSQESRQLNCIAESLVYSYRDGIKSANRIPSRNIADLTIDLALHPKIGRRNESEIDYARIYQAVDNIVAYFGSEKIAEFNWTLDKTNTSFEELMRVIASATCTHDRRVNRKIYYDLESANDKPIILFNHRNKVTKTETRGYTIRNKYDGVELTYVDSENGWVEKILKVPNDLIVNAKKIDGTGIVYKEQAHIVAWREWNKAVFTRTTATFKALCESDLVFRGDCVLNTDDTRIDNTSSGEIVSYSGLTIETSQPFNISSGYVIHMQMKSGQIDVINISQGSDEYHFILSRPPMESLVTQGEVKTAYIITKSNEVTAQRFLVSSKKPLDEMFENELTLTNLDERFYRNDKDIINDRI